MGKIAKVGVKILHFNAQCLTTALHELEMLTFENKPHFLCITEHWLTASTIAYYVPVGYRLISSACRGAGEHGGAAVYARADLWCVAVETIVDLSETPLWECAAVETRVDGRIYVIISVYRSTRSCREDASKFFDFLYHVCELIIADSKYPLLAGDFNINLLIDNNMKLNFVNFMNAFNLKPTIDKPTRIHGSTGTCIDNIVIPSEIGFGSIVIPCFSSDHMAQLVELDLNHQVTQLSTVLALNVSETFAWIYLGKAGMWCIMVRIRTGSGMLSHKFFLTTLIYIFHIKKDMLGQTL